MSAKAKRTANNTEAVERYMAELDHPFKAEVQAIREAIKGVSPEITEEVKWNAPSFSYRGEYLATFHLRARQHVHLVFHNPAVVEIVSPLLEGEYKDRRMTYFKGADDWQSKRAELERVFGELLGRIDAR